MALERLAQGFAARHVPQHHGLVRARGGERLAVGAEGDARAPPLMTLSGSPSGLRLATSHRITVSSSLAEASVLPSGLKATLTPTA